MRISDWSSDVCSSDLGLRHRPGRSGGTTPRHVRRRVTTCTGTTAYNPRCPTVSTAMRSILPVIACLVLLSAGCERASLTAGGFTAEAAGNEAAGTDRTGATGTRGMLVAGRATQPADTDAIAAAPPRTGGPLPALRVPAQPFVKTGYARFDEPWAMAFLPDGRLLVTEKSGRLRLFDPASGQVGEIVGVPAVAYGGQGGFGDVVPHPQFASNGLVYISYAEQGDGDTRGAAVARATLTLDAGNGGSLSNLPVIWRPVPQVTGSATSSPHIAFAPLRSGQRAGGRDRRRAGRGRRWPGRLRRRGAASAVRQQRARLHQLCRAGRRRHARRRGGARDADAGRRQRWQPVQPAGDLAAGAQGQR